MITKDNVYFHEWIGLNAKVISSPNPAENGIAGTLCNETKNTVELRKENGVKRIVKSGRVFELATTEEKFTINGSYAVFRPEDRIKERRRIGKMLRNGIINGD
ncbi:hypothetical protein IX51_00435 [uncultured archaeon]|nr:hypothetical protein IX51_00435 [uncultured archaeon]